MYVIKKNRHKIEPKSNKNDKVKIPATEQIIEHNVEYSTDCTQYATSDEERMTCNNIDEDVVSYPVFDITYLLH